LAIHASGVRIQSLNGVRNSVIANFHQEQAVSVDVCIELPNSQRTTPTESKTVRARIKTPVVILCLVVTSYLALSFGVLRAGLRKTDTLVYPLDDTYIAMAMAKNLALHGVMGISATHFVPATSCPGFLLLLAAAYRLTGPAVWWPLALSLAFGVMAIFMAQRLLAAVHWKIQLAALLTISYFTPLHLMGLLGMEHTLHLLLVLAFLHVATDTLAKQKSPSWGLMLLTSFMVSVRYESLFLIAVACLLFLLSRQVTAAIRLGLAAAAPVVLFAAISVLNGCYWLPHSIALKGLSVNSVTRTPIEIVRHFEFCLVRAPYLGVLLVMIVVLLTIPQVLADRRTRSMLVIIFGGILLHLALADVGWVYRYEAYLIGATIATIAYAIQHLRTSRDQLAIVLLLVFATIGSWMLAQRTVEAERTFPERSAAVYDQQVQMARFLTRFENGASVAANDVGAINYYADIDCLDLVGLGDREIFWLKHRKNYTTSALTKLAADRKIRIAVVYDSWFSFLPKDQFSGPPLPTSWIRVVRWHTPYGEYLGGDTVSFYAANPVEAANLKSSLALFAPSLPPDVEVLDK
jgi:hypothetical protein